MFCHADDVAARGLSDGDRVDITSHFDDGIERTVNNFRVVAYDIPRGCCAGYFPELNVLASLRSVAIKSNTPVSKLIPVTLSVSESKA